MVLLLLAAQAAPPPADSGSSTLIHLIGVPVVFAFGLLVGWYLRGVMAQAEADACARAAGGEPPRPRIR